MNRREFLNVVPAAFVATNLTPNGETVPSPTRADLPIPLAPSGVTQRRLYRTDDKGTSYKLIATAGPDDREWTYLPAPTAALARTKKKHAKETKG